VTVEKALGRPDARRGAVWGWGVLPSGTEARRGSVPISTQVGLWDWRPGLLGPLPPP
jgi:hypothetical protein